MPADTELSRHDPDVPEWDSLSTSADGGLRGFLSHNHHIGGHDFLPNRGADNDRDVVQRARPRRPAAPRRMQFLTPRSRWKTASRRSTSSAARQPSTTTRGAGRGRATHRSAAGSARPTAAARPTRSSCTGLTASRAAARSATTRAHSAWPWRASSAQRMPEAASSRLVELLGLEAVGPAALVVLLGEVARAVAVEERLADAGGVLLVARAPGGGRDVHDVAPALLVAGPARRCGSCRSATRRSRRPGRPGCR